MAAQVVAVARPMSRVRENLSREAHNLSSVERYCPVGVSRLPSVARRLVDSARSKTNAVDSEITGHQNYDDHYANYGKEIHSALLPLHDGVRSVRTLCTRRYRLGPRWLGSAEDKRCCYRHRLYPQ
jgi:hypothetical protein